MDRDRWSCRHLSLSLSLSPCKVCFKNISICLYIYLYIYTSLFVYLCIYIYMYNMCNTIAMRFPNFHSPYVFSAKNRGISRRDPASLQVAGLWPRWDPDPRVPGQSLVPWWFTEQNMVGSWGVNGVTNHFRVWNLMGKFERCRTGWFQRSCMLVFVGTSSESDPLFSSRIGKY